MRQVSRYLRDRRGATAVEFALVASILVLTIMFIMVVSTILYINQALDYATSQATRQILTGAAQKQATPFDQAALRTSLCGHLPAAMQCGNLVINLYVVTEAAGPAGYYAYVKSDTSGLAIPTLSPNGGQFTLGGRGDYQYLQVIYPVTFLPSAFAALLSGGATFNGSRAYLAVATAAFRNEQY